MEEKKKQEKMGTPRPGTDMKPEEYKKYVQQVTPVHNTPLNMAKAFLTGGIICTIGQFFMNTFANNGLDKDAAGAWTLLILIGSTVLLTGLNLFPKIVTFGGAGALVPITGFANSVVAPAIEYKKDERDIIGLS